MPAPNSNTLDEARTLWQRVAAWGLANSIAQKFQIENADASNRLGRPIDMLPFGNVTVQAPQPTAAPSGTNPLLAAALGAALGAGGLGLGSYLAGKPAGEVAAPVATAPENIPLTIDWEFTPDGQRANESE